MPDQAHSMKSKMLPGMLEVQEDPPTSLAGHIRNLSMEGNGQKLNSMFFRVPHALGYWVHSIMKAWAS